MRLAHNTVISVTRLNISHKNFMTINNKINVDIFSNINGIIKRP